MIFLRVSIERLGSRARGRARMRLPARSPDAELDASFRAGNRRMPTSEFAPQATRDARQRRSPRHSEHEPRTGRGHNTFGACLTARSDFVRKYPVAAKRALRASLKAATFVAQESGKRAGPFSCGKGTRAAIASWRWRVLQESSLKPLADANAEDSFAF